MFQYIINNVEKQNENWKFYRLCKIDGNLELLNSQEQDTESIKKEAAEKNLNDDEIGNKLRRRFEVIIYELAKMNNVGELQETSVLLDKMCTPKEHTYLSIDLDGD